MGIMDFIKKKPVPTNNGILADNNGIAVLSRYHLEFSSLPMAPKYELVETLTVGRKVGDVVLESAPISDRHATFALNQGVISIIDHGSIQGTFIGKKKIPAGRLIILQDGDEIKLAELPVKILVSALVPEEEEIDTTPINASMILTKEKVENTTFMPSEAPMQMSKAPKEPTAAVEISGFEIDTALTLENSHTNNIQKSPEDKTQEIDALLISKLNEVNNESGHGSKNKNQRLEKMKQKLVSFFKLDKNKHILKGKPNKGKIKVKPTYNAANAILRILAIFLDMIVAVIFYNLIDGHQDVISLIDELPIMVLSLLTPLYQSLLAPFVTAILQDYPAVSVLWTDIKEFFQGENIVIYHTLVLYVLLRLITTFIFGVSLGQFFIGLTSQGHIILKRLGGVFREILGIFLGPFLCFDVPAIFSHRTLKEVVTFTCVEAASYTRVAVLAPLSLIFFTALFILSPIFKGMEFKTPIPMTTLAIKRTQLNNVKRIESMWFGVQFPEEGAIIHANIKNKIISGNSEFAPALRLEIQYGENKHMVDMERLPNFSLRKILKAFLQLNFMARERYSELASYAYSVASDGAAYTGHSINKEKFMHELQEVLESSFSLELNTIVHHVENHGPWIKGHVDFRSEIEKIVEFPFSDVQLVDLGNIKGALFTIDRPGQEKVVRFFSFFPQEASLIEFKTQERIFPTTPLLEWAKGWHFFDVVNKVKTVASLNYHPLNDIDILMGKITVEEISLYQKDMIKSLAVNLYNQMNVSTEDTTYWSSVLQSYIKVIDQKFLQNEKQSPLWTNVYNELIMMLEAYRDKNISHFQKIMKN